MKTISHFGLAKRRCALGAATLCCIGAIGSSFVYAASDGDFNNSIDIAGGGFSVNKAGLGAFAHNTQLGGASEFYAGLQNLHVEKDLTKNLSVTVDGRSLLGVTDNDWTIALTNGKLGYVKFGYNEYETYYGGNAGFYPNATSSSSSYVAAPDRTRIAPYQDVYSVDRGSIWFESGLRKDNLPEITFRGEHDWRRGEKDSTSWGNVASALLPNSAYSNANRKLSPTFLQLDETRDIWSLDLAHSIGKTDFGAGLRIEHFGTDNFRQENMNPENATIGSASGNHMYQSQEDGYKGDNLSAHAFSQTHLNDKVSVAAGYAYAQSNTDVMGSRTVGSWYSPSTPFTGVSNTYRTMGGEDTYRDSVLNLNIDLKPIKDLSITPSIRAERQSINGWDARTDFAASPVTTTVGNNSLTKSLAEGLDLRYTGIENILLYSDIEFSQDDSQFAQSSKASTATNTTWYSYDDGLDNDKFVFGANWYPLSNLSVATQAYHKDRVDAPSPQSILSGVTQLNQNYNSYLLAQNTSTNGANIRVTWRARQNLSLVTRYDLVSSHYSGGTYGSAGFEDREGICNVTSQILSESVTWNATSRFYILGSAHVGWGLTNLISSASNNNPNGKDIVVDFQNNFWDGVVSAGYQVNDKTNIDLTYTCAFSNNPAANSPEYLEFGSRSGVQALTVGVTHQFTPNLSGDLKAGYFQNRDATSGNYNDYDARVVSTSLHYRF